MQGVGLQFFMGSRMPPRRYPLKGKISYPSRYSAYARPTQKASDARRSSYLSSKRPYVSRAARYSAGPTSDTEVKFFDTLLAAAAIDSTAENLSNIALVPQNATESGRIGRKIVVKGINIKGFLTWGVNQANSVFVEQYVRLVLVWDKQANGASATYTDVYDAATVTSLRNLENGPRFKILKDWVFVPTQPLQSTTDNWATVANSVANTPCMPFDYNINNLNIPMEFSSTTGAIGEIKTNNFFLLAMSNAGDDVNKVTATCRLRYVG